MAKSYSIEPLELPVGLPSEQAMKVNNHNRHSYDPEMWDFEYSVHRPLQSMTDEALARRYVGVRKGLRSHLKTGRVDCPINLYHGPWYWYWYRAEHCARLEFKIRGIDPPELTDAVKGSKCPVEVSERFPIGEEVLFKYTKLKYAKNLRDFGELMVSPATSYLGAENNAAQQDDERRKSRLIPKHAAKIVTEQGEEIRPISDVTSTVSGPDYHQTSFSTVWDEAMFDEFECDSCVVIGNPTGFFNAAELAGQQGYPNWYFMHANISYFDPSYVGLNERLDAALSKDFRYAFQREYRLFWAQINAAAVPEAQLLKVDISSSKIQVFARDGSLIN